MAANLEAMPQDELTRIVRPIFVVPEDFPNSNPLAPETHYHHNIFNRKRREIRDQAGKALRKSYGQRLPRELHFNAYPGSLHDIFTEPDYIPDDIDGKHEMAVLHAAKVIPRLAIELTGSGYRDRQLTESEHAFISSGFVTNHEDYSRRRGVFIKYRIGRFFLDYALGQDMLEIASAKQRDRYLYAKQIKDTARVKELGNLMIYNAVNKSLEHVKPTYEQAKKAGMVSSAQRGLRHSVYKFLPYHEFGNYYDELETTLQTGVDAVQLAA